jgi:hypothetical protein
MAKDARGAARAKDATARITAVFFMFFSPLLFCRSVKNFLAISLKSLLI